MHGKIRLSKSSIGQREKAAVLKVLDSEFLGMGEEVQAFEKEIKSYLKTDKEVICVNTGTSALHLALSALDVGTGDEVLVPSLTYVASYQAISATGAKPISCEVNENTLFIDVEDARSKVTKNTKVIMPIHYASNSLDMSEVYSLAKEFNLRVLEDAAQAFGCKRNNDFIGKDGDIICFSFDGIKNITSGEGGAILSSDEEFIQRVKDSRLLGVEKDTEKRYNKERSWDFDVLHQGFRYHMSNIMAAIGREQLNRIEEFRVKRQEVVQTYLNNLDVIEEIQFLDFNYDEIISHIFVIKATKRDELREYLLKSGVECGVHYKPNHLLSKYKIKNSLMITEGLYESILTLPCHYDLTNEDLEYIIDVINKFYK